MEAREDIRRRIARYAVVTDSGETEISESEYRALKLAEWKRKPWLKRVKNRTFEMWAGLT